MATSSGGLYQQMTEKPNVSDQHRFHDSDPALPPISDPEPHLTTWLFCLETSLFALVVAALFCENSSIPYIPATPYKTFTPENKA